MIKTTIISQPTTREIVMKCPGCKVAISRYIPRNQRKGETECAMCGTKFQWEETVNA
jgi:transcription elongation factor Elf1